MQSTIGVRKRDKDILICFNTAKRLILGTAPKTTSISKNMQHFGNTNSHRDNQTIKKVKI
jgi:hypothetical protein